DLYDDSNRQKHAARHRHNLDGRLLRGDSNLSAQSSTTASGSFAKRPLCANANDPISTFSLSSGRSVSALQQSPDFSCCGNWRSVAAREGYWIPRTQFSPDWQAIYVEPNRFLRGLGGATHAGGWHARHRYSWRHDHGWHRQG